MKATISFVSFILGTFGIAGAIENNSNPTVAILLFIIGLVLMIGDLKSEKKTTDYTSKSDNRPYFLH